MWPLLASAVVPFVMSPTDMPCPALADQAISDGTTCCVTGWRNGLANEDARRPQSNGSPLGIALKIKRDLTWLLLTLRHITLMSRSLSLFVLHMLVTPVPLGRLGLPPLGRWLPNDRVTLARR